MLQFSKFKNPKICVIRNSGRNSGFLFTHPLPMKNPLSHHLTIADFTDLWQFATKKKYPKYLFLSLCLNLIVAPAVYAANADSFTRFQAYALGLLGIVTLSFSIYLFVVMFQPEKF